MPPFESLDGYHLKRVLTTKEKCGIINHQLEGGINLCFTGI